MRDLKQYSTVLLLSLAALLVMGAAVFFISHNGAEKKTVLEIRDANSGKIYGKWLLEDAEFSIEFIHSVNQSPVREKFKVEGKMIQPCEVRFSSFGAGMQSDLGQGQTMSRDGDALLISGAYAPHTELNYIVGTVSDHLLFIKNETISLRELCGQNAQISIRIK